MPEITIPNKNTKFDPNVDLFNKADQLGIKPVILADKKFGLDSQSDTLNSFSAIKASDYGDGISLYGSDQEASAILNERRAQNQGAGEQLLKGLGHLTSTLGTEILKTPGYIGGLLAAPAMEGSVIENIVDNAWVNAFEDLDAGIKEQLPVYLTKDVQEGNIGRKLMSSAWWSTTGAEGIGFMLSMFAPGQALKALGVGAKIGKGIQAIAKESKLAKVITSEKFLKPTVNGLEMTADGISKIESTAAVALNTYIESAAEAANTFDNVKKQYLQDNPDATEEQAKEVAGTAAANVMKANIGVLMLSNAFDELFLFKGFAGGAEKIAEQSLLGKIMKGGVINSDEIGKLKKAGFKEFVKEAPLKIASNFAKEGLFEEGLQTKIQQYYENVASGKTNASFTQEVLGDYFESLFNDPEMQEAVVLGGILGSGASMFGLASDIKTKNEMLYGRAAYEPSAVGRFFGKKSKQATKGLATIMNENFINSTRSIFDIAEKDANGKIVQEDGKIKINESKLKDLVEQKDGLLLLNQLHNIAILEGNKVEEDFLGDLLSFNYFLPFLQQDSGFEILNQHISNQLVDLMAKKSEDAGGKVPTDEDKEKLKTKLLAKAKEYKDIYDTVSQTTNTEFYIPVDNPQEYTSWKENVKNRKLQSLISYKSAQKSLNELNVKYPEGVDESTLSPDKFIEFKIFGKLKEEYQKRIDESKSEYQRLSSEKGLKEDYEKFNKDIKEDLEKVQEIVEEENKKDIEVATTSNKIQSLKEKALVSGYAEDEVVILEDGYGDRFKLDPVTGKVTNAFGHIVKHLDDMFVLTKETVSREQQEYEKLKTNLRTAEESKKILDIRQNYKELGDINKINEQFLELKAAVKELYSDRVSGKFSKLKKLFKIKELSETPFTELVTLLQNRLSYLENLPLNDQTAIDKTKELLLKAIELRSKIVTIKLLDKLTRAIATKDRSLLTRLHQEFPNAAYDFRKLMDGKTAEKVLGNKDTTLKNNLATIFKDNITGLIKAKEIADSVKELDKAAENFLSTPEGLDLKNYTLLTNLESDELYNLSKDFEIDLNYFEDFQSKLDTELSDIYHNVSEEILEKTVHSSQKESGSSAEIIEEPADLNKIFTDNALPKTPFTTTGQNVKYDQQGNDVLDNDGYPQITTFQTQRNWFNTIDELADTIQDYTLTPVTGGTTNPELLAAIKSGFSNPEALSNNDVFVFLTDKDGNLVKRNNQYVFTSLRKPISVFPQNGKPRLASDYIINEYLNSLGIPAVENFDTIKNQKVSTFVLGKQARAKLKDLIESDATGETLFVLATEYVKEQYEEFINEILNSDLTNKVLKIENVTKGYQLYRVQNGKRVKNRLFEVFNEIQLTELSGTNQLKGGKLGVVVNADIKVGTDFLKLPKGTVYFQFDNNDVITLDSRFLNEDEVNTVIYLLSLANSSKDLNTITIPSKNGYTFNGKSIGKNIPVFFKKAKTTEQAFSILETLINYGLRKDTKNKKGEIYIQSGKVVFTDFDGSLNEVPLNDLTEFIKSKNQTESLSKLVSFLKQKRFNVHNLMIANNPKFIYPIYKDGKLTVDESKTYYEFLLNNVLTTTAMSVPGYPKRLQRNISFKPELETVSKKAPATHTENKPPTIDTNQKDTQESIINRQILGWKTQLDKFDPKGIKDILEHQLSNMTGFAAALVKIGIQPTQEHVTTIFNGVYDIKPASPVLENKTKLIDDQIADIEKRRESDLIKTKFMSNNNIVALLPKYGYNVNDFLDKNREFKIEEVDKVFDEIANIINAKYDAEITALQNKDVITNNIVNKNKLFEKELFTTEVNKKGFNTTYYSNTIEKDGITTTTFTFNRSDKDPSQRNKAIKGVPVNIAFGDKYVINEENIPEGAKVNGVIEIRIDAKGRADATVVFENQGETYIGEVPLKENTDNLKYKNIEVIDTENIVNAEGKKGAAQLDRDNNVIKINRKILKVKFEEKAWTKPRDLIEVIHGEKVTSAAQALPEDQFSNYQEFENFVMEHEYQHSIYTREDFDKDFPNKTKGDYESEINNRALKELGLSEKITEQASLEKPKKLSAKEKLAKLKGEKTAITLGKTPTADKRIDSESLLDYYIKNNIVQKNCK